MLVEQVQSPVDIIQGKAVNVLKIDSPVIEGVHLGGGVEDAGEDQQAENSFHVILYGSLFFICTLFCDPFEMGDWVIKLFYEFVQTSKVFNSFLFCFAVFIIRLIEIEPCNAFDRNGSEKHVCVLSGYIYRV